jgi:hypothetical protein
MNSRMTTEPLAIVSGQRRGTEISRRGVLQVGLGVAASMATGAQGASAQVGTPIAQAAFYPAGSVDGNVTTAAAAEEMSLWGICGRADGAPFVAEAFLRLHPQYAWQEGYLKSRLSQPWTFFEGSGP